MNLILEFLKFIIFSLGIVTISKYMLVPVLRKISIALKLSPKASGNIAGFATSVPELLTVSFSAASGLIGTSVYNILSSNIINLIQYIFAIYLNKNQKFLRNRAISIDIFLVIATIIIPFVLAIFNVTLGITSVVIFLILLVVFYYINHNVHKIYLEKEDEKIKKEELEEVEEAKKNIKSENLIEYFKYVIQVLNKYNIDAQGIFEYMRAVVETEGIEIEKIWKEDQKAPERRYERCIYFKYEGNSYLIDTIEKSLKDISKKDLDPKIFIENPEENQYKYYGG